MKDTTRAKKKEKRRQERCDLHSKTRAEATRAQAFSPDATMAHKQPIHMKVKRHPDCDTLVSRNKVVQFNDPILGTYKRITGKESCLIYCLDATNWTSEVEPHDRTEIVLIASIELFSDMEATRRSYYQWMFTYLKTDMAYKPPISSNHAMLGGIMKGIGWRAGYERGIDIGAYAANATTAKKIRRNDEYKTAYKAHVIDDALEFHKRMAQCLFAMSPKLHRDRVHEARESGMPMAGLGAATFGLDATTQPVLEDTLFTPHIIYTYNGFFNLPHCDNDKNVWASGIFAAVDTNGTLLDEHDTVGFHFYNARYGVLVDIASVPGIVNLAWRGKLDIHGTTTGSFQQPGITRFAATAQLNIRTDMAATRCLSANTMRVRDDIVRYNM